MPCTAGGRPVTIERLLGLVKLGMPQRPRRFSPWAIIASRLGISPSAVRQFHVVRFAAVAADDHQRPVGPAIVAAVDRRRILRFSGSLGF